MLWPVRTVNVRVSRCPHCSPTLSSIWFAIGSCWARAPTWASGCTRWSKITLFSRADTRLILPDIDHAFQSESTLAYALAVSHSETCQPSIPEWSMRHSGALGYRLRFAFGVIRLAQSLVVLYSGDYTHTPIGEISVKVNKLELENFDWKHCWTDQPSCRWARWNRGNCMRR